MPDLEGAQNPAMLLRLLHRAESEVPIGRDADVVRTGMNLNVRPVGDVKVRGAFENNRNVVHLTEWLFNLCHRYPLGNAQNCPKCGHRSSAC
jgi:hypothetical protein